MTQAQINRRRALAVVAAVPAAITLSAGFPAATEAVPGSFKFGIGEGSRSFGVRVLTDVYEPEYPKGSIAIIDPDLEPNDDDLVLVKIHWETFPASIMLLPFWKKAGHDEHGRFCQAGDPGEIVLCLGPIAFTREDFAKYVEFQGTARGVVRDAEGRVA